MFPALLTTLLWSYCLIPARRSVAQLGENGANFWRLLVAVLVMGLFAAVGGIQLGHAAFGWFFLSGIIGFGFGDIGVWFALPRIGSRLTLLMVHCLAAPLAGLAEWLWLGTTVSMAQLLALLVILPGVSLALFPDSKVTAPLQTAEQGRRYGSGILFGILAALGQSMGAVCSRKAFSLVDMSETGLSDFLFLGATSGFARLIGGLLIASGFWLISRWYGAWRTKPEQAHRYDSIALKSKNVLLCAAAGPIFGVVCYQWALATTPSIIVQMIVSLSPLVILPMTWIHEHDRPSARSLIGTLIAVAGVMILAFAR